MSELEQKYTDHERLLQHGVKLNTICKKMDESKEGQEKILEKIEELNTRLNNENKDRMETCLQARTDFNKTYVKGSTFWKIAGALFIISVGSYSYAYIVADFICTGG